MFHFAKPWWGLRSLTRVKVFFVDLKVNFGEIQHFTRPGFFGTGYTSTHTMVNIQKTNYTLRRFALSLFPSSTIEQVLCAAPLDFLAPSDFASSIMDFYL